jgi:hypothetical protein
MKTQSEVSGNDSLQGKSVSTRHNSSLEAGGGRRRFLKLAGATLLAGATWPKPALASINHFGGDFTYEGGVVFNPDLPGLSGQLILNVYLAVAPDGTGLGTLSDPVHSTVNSHLAVESATRHGNEIAFIGVILRSNDQTRVGTAFVVTSYVQGDFTSLVLDVNGQTFTGQGFHVDAAMLRVD